MRMSDGNQATWMRNIEAWERMSWPSLVTKALVIGLLFRKPIRDEEKGDHWAYGR